ncbi:phage head-tail adaptor, putative, SPP1 family [Hoeflea sp. IMCC20628]|nr:phage head-tail adaptor, putative, SPP1 family [Hoeflea sp. IMCC20628]
MRAGKLDRTITIERLAETISQTGAVSSAWTNIATVRAEIVTQSATEFLNGFGEAEDGSIVFRIRHLSNISTADRVIYDATAYNVKEISEIGRRRGLELRTVATS